MHRSYKLTPIAAALTIVSPLSVAQSIQTAEPGEIEEITVIGFQTSAFRREETSTAGIFDMAMDDTPFNVGVITEDLIEDRQIFTLRDAVLSNASVTRQHTHSSTSVSYNIRGFALNLDRLGFLVNGVPVAANDAPPAHISALDRIEVLKGASTLYYGAGEPAGVVNYVYKMPLDEAQYSISATVGQFNDYRAELDATGPLGSPDLLYRFTLGWRDSEGVVDHDFKKDLAPTLQLQWSLSEDTTMRLIGEYVEHESNPIVQDAFYIDGRYLDAPKSDYYGFTTDYEDQQSAGVQLHLDHQFTDNLKLRTQVGWKDGGREAGNSGYMTPLPFVIPGFNDPANGLLARSAFDQQREAETSYLASHVAWTVETGALTHDLVVGVNYSQNQIKNVGFFNSALQAIPSIIGGDFSILSTVPPSVNIFDPVPVAYQHRTNFDDSPPFYRDIWEFENLGLNIQDSIEIPEWNLQFLLGARYSRAEFDAILSLQQDGSPGVGIGAREANSTSDSAWIPRVGVIYDVNDNHSMYASYGESWLPPFGTARDINGEPITEPEIGVMYELGWRGSFFENKLSSTVAVYELTKENIVVGTFNPEVSELSGEQRSRGLEIDLTGRFSNFWDVYVSYAYTDTEVIEAGPINQAGQSPGDPFPGIPEHKLVLWNTISLDWTGVTGLSLGYGFDYMSDTIASALVDAATLQFGPVDTPAQGLVHNANLNYETELSFGRLNFNLGVTNLTDKAYVLNTTNTLFARRAPRRQVLLTTQLTF
ncbi:MAG: TonB-dependent siderophore receptor [Pseudomonadota bacterium]